MRASEDNFGFEDRILVDSGPIVKREEQRLAKKVLVTNDKHFSFDEDDFDMVVCDNPPFASSPSSGEKHEPAFPVLPPLYDVPATARRHKLSFDEFVRGA